MILNTIRSIEFLKSVVILSPRQGSTKQEGGLMGMATTLWTQGIIDPSSQANTMVTQRGQKVATLAPERLLGPLNDVERKYAPSKLFTMGPMETPLPRPRVAIIGSRKASPDGLAAAARRGRAGRFLRGRRCALRGCPRTTPSPSSCPGCSLSPGERRFSRTEWGARWSPYLRSRARQAHDQQFFRHPSHSL